MFAYSFALMERAKAELNRLRSDRKGVTAVEYAIIAAVLVAALGTAFSALTGDLKDVFDKIGTTLQGKVT
ncbi:MAG TPA: Flp family type IVb pilin [Acetobacteraceae bacterium]